MASRDAHGSAPVRRRLAAQLLSGSAPHDPVSVVERLLAVQGQDGRGVRLAIRARSRGLTAADVDRALTQDRSLVISWINRGTLHLVRSEDFWWLHALTNPQLLSGITRRLREEGVSERQAELGVRTIARALENDGPLTRRSLSERLQAVGVPTRGQALVHVLALTSLRGLIVRGPVAGADHAYALTADWLGSAPRVDAERAIAELARRYLAGHGPASAHDLAKWAGVALGRARAGLRAIGDELVEHSTGLVDLARPGRSAPMPKPKLLGAFDPVLLGWVSRDAIVGDAAPHIVAGGVFRPFALVDGRVAATWGLQAREVVLDPLRRLHPAERAALDREARDVRRFLGLPPS